MTDSISLTRRWLYALGCFALFALGLFGAGALVATRIPFSPEKGVREKIDWLAEHEDRYDTFFLGTSRTFGGIRPDLFDQAMAAAGTPTHSFNLGINGMRPPEDSYVLEQVLARRHRPLKLVVVECNPVHIMTDFDGR